MKIRSSKIKFHVGISPSDMLAVQTHACLFLLQVALSKPQRNFHESSSIRSKGNIKPTGIPLELSKMSNNVFKNRFSKYEHS